MDTQNYFLILKPVNHNWILVNSDWMDRIIVIVEIINTY